MLKLVYYFSIMKKEQIKRKRIRLNGKTVRISRLLMALHLGRSLDKNEVVHHLDEDPTNDSIDNLQIMSRSDHSRIHHLSGKYKLCDLPPKPKARFKFIDPLDGWHPTEFEIGQAIIHY